VDGPPGHECFAGDNRGFSDSPSASSRTHQGIEVKAEATSPTVDIRRIGTTHEVDCTTGTVLAADGAPPIQVHAYDPRPHGEGVGSLFPPMEKEIRTWFSF
jgi:hypothetical protein